MRVICFLLVETHELEGFDISCFRLFRVPGF